MCVIPLSSPHTKTAHPGRAQGFVEEMTGIAQMMWLNDFYTSNDKKGIITKARLSSAGQPEDVVIAP